MAPSFQSRRAGSGKNDPPQQKSRLSLSSILCCRPFKQRALDTTFQSEKVDRSLKAEILPSEGDYERGNTAMSGPVQAEPYHWPHDGRLESATTALVVIDMQRDFCEDDGYMAYQGYDISPAKNVIPVIKSLLVKFRESGYPIYFTREGHRPDLSTLSTREHYRSRNNAAHLGIGDQGPLGRLLIRGESGHHIVEELRPLENEPIIDKPGRGAFAHTEFGLMLSIKGIKNLIICGVTTDVCVTSTLREANDRRFDCILISDACAAGEVALHDAAVQTIKEEGGIFGTVTSSEELLRALEKTSVNSAQGADSHSKLLPLPNGNPHTVHSSQAVDGAGTRMDESLWTMSAAEETETERAQLLNKSSDFPSSLPPKTPQKDAPTQYLSPTARLPENPTVSQELNAPSSSKKRSSMAMPWKAAFSRFGSGSSEDHDRKANSAAGKKEITV